MEKWNNFMKFDKETIIAGVLCIAFLFAWPHVVQKIWPHTSPAPTQQLNNDKQPVKSPVAPPKQSVSITPEAKAVQAEKAVTDKTVSEKSKTVADKIASALTAVKKLPPVILKNQFITVTISPNAGEISSIILNKYKTADKKNNIRLLNGVEYGALGIYPTNAAWTLTGISLQKSETPEKSLTVKRIFTSNSKKFAVTQTWSLDKNYIIKNSLKITNLSSTPISLKNIAVNAGGIEKITELAGDKVFRENHEINYYSINDGKMISESAETGAGFFAMITGAAKNAPKKGFEKSINEKAKWIGVTNKYFTSLLVPEKPFNDGLLLRSVILKDKKEKEYVMAEAAGIINFDSIGPEESQVLKFKYFAGPKKITLLKELDPDASKIMKLYMLGMRFLEPVSRIMLDLLMWLKNWCGSYGLSIILLTLIVKTLFWPITHRANVSMRKMQKIQPLIKELRKKYKDKPQQMNQEMMKLYKEHKVNPLGGCLPILLQMPVFFALYATLSGSIEPRHTAFLWMHDLSMPDTVAHLFGLPINPLMLMMTATMVLQQKLTPSAADPAQQKMMMFMPLIMLVMLYNLPSGLTLYWTVSQFISIAQLLVNKEIEKRAELREAGA